MKRFVRYFSLLLIGLGALSLLVFALLSHTSRQWFEKDVRLRTDLAVAAAHQSLVAHWNDGPDELRETLDDLTHDERILGAAACAPGGRVITSTADFPGDRSCEWVETVRQGTQSGEAWTADFEMARGPVRLSATPLDDHGRAIGSILILHDLGFVGRRETTTRNILLASFFTLALLASATTLALVRVAYRQWTKDLRSALAGKERDEFRPLLRDVRDLVETLVAERGQDAKAGPWNAERLKSTLRQYLHGERVVVLANREPYIHDKNEKGIRVLHPASGLVTALEPIMRACSGTWVAHGAGNADREMSSERGHVRVPPGEESYTLRRVWLSEEEEQGYYYGFSNEGLWPLCHVAHTRPTFRASDWEKYREVNQRFADAVCEETDTEDPIILVQDYHFALAPKMIRERLPRATILTFWHIPWPNAERIGICPWREELIQGLLGSSILGFHIQQHCNNFLDSVDAFVESRIDRETNTVVQGPSRTAVRPYPISIEWPVRWLEGMPSVDECRRLVREELGVGPETMLGVGVDRLDYTKGIEERVSAVDTMLEKYPELRGKFVFVQLAAPSRTKIDKYRELAERVEALVAATNARWGSEGYQPVVLLRAHHEPRDVFRYFRASEVCYVSSLHDGMNLVAKEFVAARDDERGVLVLSEFTGAARDLTESLIVNPYDIGQAADALATALAMPAGEQRDRMRSMRRVVSELNVYRWAGRMLVDSAELRRRERLTGRWSQTPTSFLPA